MRINKQDISIDEKRYKLWTSRRIIVRRQKEIKDMKLMPAIVEFIPDQHELEIEVEFL